MKGRKCMRSFGGEKQNVGFDGRNKMKWWGEEKSSGEEWVWDGHGGDPGKVAGKERECEYVNCGSWRVNVSANMALHFYTTYLISFYFISCVAIACDMCLVKG